MPEHSTGRGRVVAIMPARNSARTLEATFKRIPPGYIDQIILVDNASKDDTVAIAERLGITVVRHPVDRGFGGSIKTLFRTALDAGADYIIELHPDNQYDPSGIPALLEKIHPDRYAMVIASRFLPAQARARGRHAVVEVHCQPHPHDARQLDDGRADVGVPFRLPRLQRQVGAQRCPSISSRTTSSWASS